MEKGTLSGFKMTVVLSDSHIGFKDSTLADSAVVDQLYRELVELEEVDHLVLLGDIWDLWLAAPETALPESKKFFKTISNLPGLKQISFVCGNHDHCIYRFHLEKRFFELATNGDDFPLRLWDLDSSMLQGLGVPPGLSVKLYFPDMWIRLGERRVLLTHGHYFDYFTGGASTGWLARLMVGKNAECVHDIEDNSLPFFEMMTATTASKQLRNLTERIRSTFRWFARKFAGAKKGGASHGRGLTIETSMAGLAGYLKLAQAEWPNDQDYKGWPEIYIYGHTHRAELLEMEMDGSRVLFANSGAWVKDDGENSYLVLDDQGVHLRFLESP